MAIRLLSSETIDGNITVSGTAVVGNTLYLAEYIQHTGNTNNNIRFQTNRMQLFANLGTAGYIDLHDNGNVYIGASNATALTITSSSATFAGSVYAPDFYMNDYIYHNGDTNTYIRAQADQWTFRTGGDDRMHIDNTGVGIFTTSPQRTLDVRGNGLSIYGSGGNTELMLRGQVEGTGTVRNLGAWHWSVRGDVGGNNDDLKLIRFVTGNYSGIAMQLGNSDGVATFYSKIIAPQLSIQNQINTTSSNLEFNFQNGDGTTTNFKDFYIRDGKNGVILNIQGSSKISNFLGNVKITTSGYPLLDIGVSSSNYFRIIHDNPGDRLTIGKNAAASLIINGNGNTSVAGLLTPTSLDTNAYLSNGYAADLHARYLGQAIYGAGTGSGDNYGTVADVFRYKDIAVWRKNSSTNAWSNPSTGNTLVQGNYAHKWSGINMEPAYSEYIFYFSNSLGYSFLSQTIVQHSTNGNSFDLYLQRASSTTNPYDSAGWTTMVTQTGISSWPGITCLQSNWEVGGGYPGLFRIRLVPSWNNGNAINIGSFQAYGSYGNFSHAWTTLFDRSVNFQSKIGVGTDPSRALDVTQTALIQGVGNVSAGTLALGPRPSGTAAWSTISGSHYNQSSGSGNGSGSGGIMMIGTYGGNGENNLYIGGGPYELNAATAIIFHTHTTDTSTAGGTERMRITPNGNVGIGTTTPNTALQVNQATTVPLLIHRPSNTNFDPHGIGFSTRNDTANGGLGDVRSGIFSDYNGDLFLAASQSSITTNPLASSRLFIEGSNGNVGIGNTSPQTTLHTGPTTTITNVFTARFAASNFFASGGNSMFYVPDTSANIMMFGSNQFGTNQIEFYHKNPGTSQAYVGRISTSGSATSYVTSSDYRLKENIIPLSESISRLNQLKPSRFNFIEEPGKVVDGFIAHEVQDIVPEAIVGEKDEVDEEGGIIPQGIDQAKLVPLLVAAVQELEARVKELENK